MSSVAKWAIIAFIAAAGAGYFALVVWRADVLAIILLGSGYSERGWDQPRLTRRLRLIGVLGLALACVGFATAAARVLG